MKLSDARLCINCEEVFEPSQGNSTDFVSPKSLSFCPACGSNESAPISRWILPMSCYINQ